MSKRRCRRKPATRSMSDGCMPATGGSSMARQGWARPTLSLRCSIALLGSMAFAAKRKALFDHSNLHLNRQPMQLDTWDERGIAARGEALADLALKIWPGPV